MNLYKSSLAAMAMVCVLLVHQILLSVPACASAILAAVSSQVAFKIFYFSFWRVFKMLVIIFMAVAVYVNRHALPRPSKCTLALTGAMALAYLIPVVYCIVRPSVSAQTAYCYSHEYYHFFVTALTAVWLALWAREPEETYASDTMGALAVAVATIAVFVLVLGADSYISAIHTGATVRWHTGALISWIVPLTPLAGAIAYLLTSRR